MLLVRKLDLGQKLIDLYLNILLFVHLVERIGLSQSNFFRLIPHLQQSLEALISDAKSRAPTSLDSFSVAQRSDSNIISGIQRSIDWGRQHQGLFPRK